jgi:hypothetical protein
MYGYAIALTIHVLGIIALFGGFAFQHRALARLRTTTSAAQARSWAELLFATRAMIPSGAVMLLASGGYLAATRWPNPPAWIPVAAVTMVLIGAVGIAVARRLGTVHRALTEADGPLSTAARRLTAGPALRSAHAAANGAALGIIWLMAAKPGALTTVLVVLVPALAGGFVGLRTARAAPVEA